LAEQDLQDFFGCEVFLNISVEPMHKDKPLSQQQSDVPTLDIFV